MWWKRLTAAYDLEDDAGALLLQTALEAFDQMRAAEKIIAAEGITFKDRFNQVRQHPATLIQRDARTAMLRGLKALNLDIEPAGEMGRPPGS